MREILVYLDKGERMDWPVALTGVGAAAFKGDLGGKEYACSEARSTIRALTAFEAFRSWSYTHAQSMSKIVKRASLTI